MATSVRPHPYRWILRLHRVAGLPYGGYDFAFEVINGYFSNEESLNSWKRCFRIIYCLLVYLVEMACFGYFFHFHMMSFADQIEKPLYVILYFVQNCMSKVACESAAFWIFLFRGRFRTSLNFIQPLNVIFVSITKLNLHCN